MSDPVANALMTLAGEQIRKQRKHQNLKIVTLSEELGYQAPFITMVEKGVRRISKKDVLLKLSQTLKFSEIEENALLFLYELDPTSTDNQKVVDYVYRLCLNSEILNNEQKKAIEFRLYPQRLLANRETDFADKLYIEARTATSDADKAKTLEEAQKLWKLAECKFAEYVSLSPSQQSKVFKPATVYRNYSLVFYNQNKRIDREQYNPRLINFIQLQAIKKPDAKTKSEKRQLCKAINYFKSILVENYKKSIHFCEISHKHDRSYLKSVYLLSDAHMYLFLLDSTKYVQHGEESLAYMKKFAGCASTQEYNNLSSTEITFLRYLPLYRILVHAKLGQFEGVLEHLDSIMSVMNSYQDSKSFTQEDLAWVYYFQGLVLGLQQKHDEAEKAFIQAYQLSPKEVRKQGKVETLIPDTLIYLIRKYHSHFLEQFAKNSFVIPYQIATLGDLGSDQKSDS